MKLNWDTRQKKIRLGDFTLTLKQIPIQDIRIYCTRSVLREDNISHIKDGMIRGDMMPPIMLNKIKKKNEVYYTIFDGHHRYTAAKDLLGTKGTVMAWV